MPLLDAIRQYAEREAQGDKKASAVLHGVIIPRFKSVLVRFMKESGMHKEDREGILLMMKGVIGNG